MFSSNRYPDAPQSQGNLAEMTPLLMNGGARAAGALGGFGGGNPFMEGFNSAYPSSGSSGYDSRIDISPLISGAIGQGNFARLNTLGGLVSPISGGLY